MQRGLERQVRKCKRLYLAEDAAGVDTGAAAVKLKSARQNLAQFVRDTGGRQDSARESVSGFGRSAASKATWAARKETYGGLSDLHLKNHPVTMESISNVKAFPCETLDAAGQRALQNAQKRLLFEASKQPLGTEVGRCYNLSIQPLCDTMIGDSKESRIRLPDFSEPYIAIHNHPDCQIFSESDISLWLKRSNMQIITAIGNNGYVFALEKTTKFDLLAAQDTFYAWKTSESNRFSDGDAYIKAMEKLLESLMDYGVRAYT